MPKPRYSASRSAGGVRGLATWLVTGAGPDEPARLDAERPESALSAMMREIDDRRALARLVRRARVERRAAYWQEQEREGLD